MGAVRAGGIVGTLLGRTIAGHEEYPHSQVLNI